MKGIRFHKRAYIFFLAYSPGAPTLISSGSSGGKATLCAAEQLLLYCAWF